MKSRFVIFLIIVVAIVTMLVLFDLNRDDPWDSDVFFGQIGSPITNHSPLFL